MRQLAVLFLAVLTGCGGGGSGGQDGAVPFFGGVWRGSVAQVRNDCGLSFFPATNRFTHTVNQTDRQVVLDVLGGGNFRGAAEEDNSGFIVTGTQATSQSGSVTCVGTPGILYTNVEGDAADVGLLFSMTCVEPAGGRVDCEVFYAGSAERDG